MCKKLACWKVGHVATRCNKRNGQTMQIERNTESETDLEKVHNLRLEWLRFRAIFGHGGCGARVARDLCH